MLDRLHNWFMSIRGRQITDGTIVNTPFGVGVITSGAINIRLLEPNRKGHNIMSNGAGCTVRLSDIRHGK